jgi:hypothetical protein
MTLEPFARDITGLSDAELDQYVEENSCRKTGATYIAVRDSQNLPDDFAQRLR